MMNYKSPFCKCVVFFVALFITSVSAKDGVLKTIKGVPIEFIGFDRIDPSAVQEMIVVDGKSIGVESTIKNLYQSKMFSDVSIDASAGKVVISIVENPTVDHVAFEGNNALGEDVLKSNISDKLSEGKVFSKSSMYEIVHELQAFYRSAGYISATVNPKMIQRSGNKVDVIFEIIEGKQAKISRIVFTGNRSYSSDELKNKMFTKENALWRLFGGEVSVFGEEKGGMDADALERFYKDEGFADFQVTRISSEMDFFKKNTYSTIMLKEGGRFTVKDIIINSEVECVQCTNFEKLLSCKKGDWYCLSLINADKFVILGELARNGKIFVDVLTDVKLDREEKTAVIIHKIVSTPRVFVERVEIEGNTHTDDTVIRRTINIHEGDPFSAYALQRAVYELRNTGYFKDVNVVKAAGSAPDQIVLRIIVEERGDVSNINFMFTLSDTDGLGGSIVYSNANFLGRGQMFVADIHVAQKAVGGSVSLTEPRFLWDNVEGSIEVGGERRNRKKEERSAYRSIHLSPSIGYSINDNVSHRVSYMFMYGRKLWVDKSGKQHNSVPEDEKTGSVTENEYGKFTVSEVSSALSYRSVDKTYKGHVGYVVTLRNSFAGVGGSVSYFKNQLMGEYFMPFSWLDDKTTFSVKGTIAHISEIRKVRSSFRFQPGGDGVSFRGFDSCGVGPREVTHDDSLGGTKMWSAGVQLKRPLSSEELGVYGCAFIDIGSVWGIPKNCKREINPLLGEKIEDKNTPRVSVGFSIEWRNCPLGAPLTFTFAVPVKKSKHDRRKAFTLSGI